MEVLYLSESLLPTNKSARRHKADYNHEEFYGSKNHKYGYILFKIAETDRKKNVLVTCAYNSSNL